MQARHLITVAVAALLVVGGAAAVGAAAPADQASDNAPTGDTADADSPDASADGIGPSGGLPEQVPDHVRPILDTIQSFQDGDIDDLGEALGELLSGGPDDAPGGSTA